jgi:gliding motility-associated-like protein
MLTPNITSPGKGAPYDFIWSTGLNDFAVSNSSINVTANFLSAPNTYSVLINDGCTTPLAIAVFTVNVNASPIIDFTGLPLQGCAPLTVTLTGTSDGANDIYIWSGNKIQSNVAGNPYYVTLLDSGKYSITLTVSNPITGCSASQTKTDYIEVYSQPIASFYSDPQVVNILDPNFNFINTSQGAISYYWHFGDPSANNVSNTSILTNPSHAYTNAGTYDVNLVATSIRGCKDTAMLKVEVTHDFSLYIPNAFTPDGNGLNDVFQPLGVGIDEDNYTMDIYDRWGEIIFTSDNFRKGWNGYVKGNSKIAPQGVYIYKIKLEDVLGNKLTRVGHVTVIAEN